jgi:ClpP class serine protease
MLDIKPNEDIDIVIDTNGGSFCAAQMISEIILNHEGTTNAIVLDKALSAGTIIALSCSNLYMHKNAHLSPVDVQGFGFFQTAQFSSVKTIIENKSADKVEDNTFIMADQANKVRALLNEMFEKIVKPKYDDNISAKIKSELFDGEKYIHSTAFSVKKLKTIGIKVLDITDSMITRSKLYDKQICDGRC